MALGSQRLTREDLQLLHEALSFARKRIYQQAELVRLQGVLDRVEELLLAPKGANLSLRLSPPEQETLEREIPLYCEAMTQRGASPQGRAHAGRLQEILGILTHGGARRKGWLRRFFPG